MVNNNILSYNNEEARNFFLKSTSYCDINFPIYIKLNKIIKLSVDILDEHDLSDISYSFKAQKHVRKLEGVNYDVTINKDGKLSWRKLSLIHPILYVNTVNIITEEAAWETITNRLNELQNLNHISCVSLPRKSNIINQTDKKATILNWWKSFEQETINLSLDFNYCAHTDISDCYGSIYTHTIAWALHGKDIAKSYKKKNNNNIELLGNVIDSELQNMQNGQTNGIPQGSTLFDFIAEIVLSYADYNLDKALERECIEDYKILRYRDDYRIFSNNKNDVEKILKLLSEILLDLNFKLNTKKTFLSEDIITDAIKKDKSYWTPIYRSIFYLKDDKHIYNISIQKHLLLIHQLSIKYPNSGSIVTALKDFDEHRITNYQFQEGQSQLVSIIIDITLMSPRVIDIGIMIISKIIVDMDIEQKTNIVNKCIKKFTSISNTDLHSIWLQRLYLSFDDTKDYNFNTKLCNKIDDLENDDIYVWNSNWIKDTITLQFDEKIIFDIPLVESLNDTISSNEISEWFY